jgi:hypothetical protein
MSSSIFEIGIVKSFDRCSICISSVEKMEVSSNRLAPELGPAFVTLPLEEGDNTVSL